MINFWIAFRNPFRAKPFRMVWNKFGHFSPDKVWELQISRYAWNWLEVQLDLNWRQTDHAGPKIMLGLFGWQFDAWTYDRRQWDHASGTWKSLTKG